MCASHPQSSSHNIFPVHEQPVTMHEQPLIFDNLTQYLSRAWAAGNIWPSNTIDFPCLSSQFPCMSSRQYLAILHNIFPVHEQSVPVHEQPAIFDHLTQYLSGAWAAGNIWALEGLNLEPRVTQQETNVVSRLNFAIVSFWCVVAALWNENNESLPSLNHSFPYSAGNLCYPLENSSCPVGDTAAW